MASGVNRDNDDDKDDETYIHLMGGLEFVPAGAAAFAAGDSERARATALAARCGKASGSVALFASGCYGRFVVAVASTTEALVGANLASALAGEAGLGGEGNIAGALAAVAGAGVRASAVAGLARKAFCPGALAAKASAVAVDWADDVLAHGSGPPLVAACAIAVVVAEEESE